MKNKILSISFILILFSLIFFSKNCYAVEYESSNYIEIQQSGEINRICANEPFYMIPVLASNGSSYYWTPYSFSTNEKIYVTLYCDGSDWYGKEVNSKVLSEKFTSGGATVVGHKGSVTLYKDSSKTDYFFQSPPEEIPEIPEETITETILAQELEKIQVAEMWKILMKNVVVSLAVFLTGLVAFLKAWAWLKMQLHKG